MGMGGQLRAPALFTAGKENRHLLYWKLGGSQGRWMDAEYLSPIVIRSRTVQPVASHYIVYAIPANLFPSGESQSTHTLGECKIIVSRTLIFIFSVFT